MQGEVMRSAEYNVSVYRACIWLAPILFCTQIYLPFDLE